MLHYVLETLIHYISSLINSAVVLTAVWGYRGYRVGNYTFAPGGRQRMQVKNKDKTIRFSVESIRTC